MNIFRPTFPTPILQIDDFLDEEAARLVLQECIDLKTSYMPAKVFDGPANTTKFNPAFRRNDVVRLELNRSAILSRIKTKIWTKECKRIWHEGDYIFDIMNYGNHQEAILSRYGNCGFYKRHRDTRWDHVSYRLVTLVYYVNRLPEQFTGGVLTIWNGDRSLKIEPRHNRAVVFPSFTFHEVEDVRLNSDKWEDGRFSLNLWMGFR